MEEIVNKSCFWTLQLFILQADRDWNSWDDSPRTVNEHIQQYRQKLVQPKTVEDNEPTIDFFQVNITITASSN